MKYVDLLYQYNDIKKEVEEKVLEIMRSFRYQQGQEVRKLEESIEIYLNIKHAIAVANGTDALVISLEALGIKPGDEIITTPFTFFASSESIFRVGAIPVFVDIDRDTYNIDVNKIESRITDKTRAILPVDIFGNPCDMDAIKAIAEKHQLLVIEDSCQAIGSEYHKVKIGNRSDIACISFFLTKNLGAMGEAGMIVTNDDNYAAMCRSLRCHGVGMDGKNAYKLIRNGKNIETTNADEKYCHYMVGFNSRMDELQAGVLNVKLKYIDKWNTMRNSNAEYYKQNVDSKYKRQVIQENSISNYHIFSIECDDRNVVRNRLLEAGVETGVHYPIPLHLQPAFASLGYSRGDLPIAERVCDRELSLPIYPGIDREEQQRIIRVLNSIE